MRKKTLRLVSIFLALMLAVTALYGCGGQTENPDEKAQMPAGTADNDILTFKSNLQNKPIIRIGTLYYTPDTSLVDALQAKFPDYLFVLDQRLSAGVNSERRLFSSIEDGEYYDMFITGALNPILPGSDIQLIDLSAESFLNNYFLSSLNSINNAGRIYSIPGTSTLSGIAFNVDMFEEHGWEIPKTHDEFFALCETIEAAGISPYSTNFKYESQVVRVITMFNYSELLETPEGAEWISNLKTAEAKFEGGMEPLFEVVKRFADMGIITADNFTASLTKQRQDFWAGEFAMIDYDSTIYTYAEAESAPFELGIMPYPAKDAEHAGFSITPEYYISIPACVEKVPGRKELMKDILKFISTQEGQEAMLADSLRISNVKNVELSDNPAAKYAEEAYSKGNLYPNVDFNYGNHNIPYFTLLQETTLSVIEGKSVSEAVKNIDSAVAESYAREPDEVEEEYRTIATAQESFTTLEMSYYIADKLREASGAEIALMINGGFFRSNLANVVAGDITSDMDRFVMKGVGAEDWLTTYSLTGAQLKEIMEHPIINDAETDVLTAASGLKLEYAPWNERGSRVIALTMEDGTEIDDDKLYTVAAWAGVIDARYISETLEVHEELGAFTDILLGAFERDKTIKPDIAGRVKLIWE